MEGRRLASIVLPEPGAPIISTLCPPAAAISSARFTWAWPFTSAKSSANRSADAPHSGAAGRAGSMRSPPFRKSTASRSVVAPIASIPSTTAASAAFAAGTRMRSSPSSLARTAMGSTPRTGRSVPSSDSSPTSIVPARRSGATRPMAARMPTAIGRSNPAPSLRRSAGARFTTIFLPDIRSPEFSNAARMRCSLSFTALSGRPTRYSPSPPPVMLTSTVTSTASIPTIVPEWVLTNMGADFMRCASFRTALRR